MKEEILNEKMKTIWIDYRRKSSGYQKVLKNNMKEQVCWRCYMSKEDVKRYGNECRDGYVNHLWKIKGEKLYRNNK